MCGIISLREKAKEIELVRAEVALTLGPAKIRYICDFECRSLKDGSRLFVEAKGYEAPRWGDIKKNWKAFGPGPLEIWGGSHASPSLLEVITPNLDKCPTCGR